MGMFDHVVVLDEPLTCPVGHRLADLQTKSFRDPSMSTYLVHENRVLRTVGRSWLDDESENDAWRILGEEAVHERIYGLEPVSPSNDIHVYAHCTECEPVLVRSDRATLWGDVVDERRVFVELVLTFSEGEPMRARRITGGRDELQDELRREGLRVLDDDEPLAVAHREIRRARQTLERRR